MRPASSPRPLLQLELLEARTLLAGDVTAIHASGTFVTSFDPDEPSAQISIASAEGGELTIDATLLPDTVTDLKISGFDSVTIVGTDSFESLELSHVGTFSGESISVTGDLTVRDVVSVDLHAVAGVAWFFGTEMRFDVDDSRSATIVTNLDRLTVSSQNDLNLLSTNAHQEIIVEFDATRPALMFPSDSVTFVDTTPAAPDEPGVDPEVPDATDEPPSYNVIFISLPTAVMSDALKAALKRGDADAVKSAFAALKTVQLSESDHNLTFAASKQAGSGVVQIQLNHAEEAFDSAAPTRSVPPALAELPLLSFPADSATFSVDKTQALLASSADNLEAGQMLAPTPLPFASLADAAGSNGAANEDAPHPRHDDQLVLESIRASLSDLVGGASRFSTVSAYIINDVGAKLEPGVLPGLLVDAKPSRVRRDAVEWIEI